MRYAHDSALQAIRWLSLALTPIVLMYAAYSLVADCHRGAYSFMISTAAALVYTLGFVLMTPQLFINYKRKSVAYLPWRKFIYRAINTFIDDLFAFIIKMPTMHRMSCFRDDVVFFAVAISFNMAALPGGTALNQAQPTCAKTPVMSTVSSSLFFDEGLDNPSVQSDDNAQPARKCASCFG